MAINHNVAQSFHALTFVQALAGVLGGENALAAMLSAAGCPDKLIGKMQIESWKAQQSEGAHSWLSR